jgi:hypothetical protein
MGKFAVYHFRKIYIFGAADAILDAADQELWRVFVVYCQ